MESSEGSNGFSELGEAYVHSELFEVGIDGIEQLDAVIWSEVHLIIDLSVYFLASFSHFFNELPSIILKIVRFEYTIVNELNGLFWVADLSPLRLIALGSIIRDLFFFF